MRRINFFRIFTSYTILGVDQKALRLGLFPFFLSGEATLGLGNYLVGPLLLGMSCGSYF